MIPWLKNKLNREQQDYLLATTRVLVYAAEQLYGAGNPFNIAGTDGGRAMSSIANFFGNAKITILGGAGK